MSNTNPFNKLKLPEIDGPRRLYFNLRNAKLVGSKTAAFSLPAGYTCPGACECLGWFDREKGKLIDGPNQKYRCYSASMEAAYTTARNSRDRNLAILKEARTTANMAEIIDLNLPPRYYEWIRVHADGDYYNQSYFLAWMEVARRNPNRTFYSYTKNLPVWVKFRKCVPENFVLTASRGGKWDNLIDKHGLRSSTVVYHPEEAEALGLPIEHAADELAKADDGKSFALLIHGGQPPGSEGSAAIKRMNAENISYSYSSKK